MVPGARATVRWAWFDRAAMAVLAACGAVALVALAAVPRFFLPAEDAVILFQYSRNLALHGAITYLAGGPRTEGATDFGWMVLIALAERCGLGAFASTAVANVLSLLGIAVLLLKLASLRVTVARVLALVGGAAFFPQIFAAAAGFSVLPFALLLTATVYWATREDAVRASFAGLLLCLFRPDGVLFVLPLLAWLLLRAKKKPAVVAVLGGFIVPGAIYFLWRWRYFGELLPLPFLVKSDASRVFGLVVEHSVRSSLIYLTFAGVVLYPLRKIKAGPGAPLFLILIVVPTLFYWSLRLDQNVGDRFFLYIPLATAILVAISWPVSAEYHRRFLVTGVGVWVLLILMPWTRELRTFRDMQFGEVKGIAEALGSMPRRGTIATSEAGFLPFYSGWKTVDLWGLNDAFFAHHFFQPSDLESIQPDLVVLHPDLRESCMAQPDWRSSYADRTWPHLTRNAVIAADPGTYELWLTSYGSEFYRRRKAWSYGEGDRECWFLRRGSPLHDRIAAILLDHHGVAPGRAQQLEATRLAHSNNGKLKP